MGIENKITSREELVAQFVEAWLEDGRSRRKYDLLMSDRADIYGEGVGCQWLIAASYEDQRLYERLGFDDANEAYDAACSTVEPEDGDHDKRNDELTQLAMKFIPEDLFWMWRENDRFRAALYAPPVFLSQLRALIQRDEYDKSIELAKHMRSLWWHFPHISLDEPHMVAYTPSPEYGLRDRQVRTKVGRYLQQFYGEFLSQDNIRMMACGVKSVDLEFSGSSSADIRAAYLRAGRDGVTSCMTYCVNEYQTYGDFHPVDAYGNGDWRVALLMDTVMGEISARALVNHKHSCFVRCYGREANTLRYRLEEKGYTFSTSWPEEAELLLIRDDDGNVVVPYVDGDTKYASIVYRDGKERVILDGGNIDLSSTSGIWREREQMWCDHCEEYVDDDEDDMEHSDYHGMSICRICIDNYNRAFSRHRCRDWILSEDTVEVDGEHYHDQYLEDYDIVYVESASEYMFTHQVIDDIKGEYVPQDCAVHLAHPTADGDEAYISERDFGFALKLVVERINNEYFLWLDDHRMDTDCEAYQEFRKRYENARTVVDDFGNLVKPDYMTLMELVHYFGVERGTDIFLRKTGMWVSDYAMGRHLNNLQQQAA